MNKATATAMTGMAAAAAVGAAALMMHQKNRHPGKKLKQNANRAIRTLGSVLDSMEAMTR